MGGEGVSRYTIKGETERDLPPYLWNPASHNDKQVLPGDMDD
jgi:hypothetical protein